MIEEISEYPDNTIFRKTEGTNFPNFHLVYSNDKLLKKKYSQSRMKNKEKQLKYMM